MTQTVNDFEPKVKKFDWSTLNEIGSKSHLIISKLVDSIIDSRLSDATRAAEYKKPSSKRIMENGKSVKKTMLIDTKPDSTDAIIKHEDGETAMIQALGNENKFGYQNQLYHPTHFMEYFKSNKNNPKNFLTNKQKEYIQLQQQYLHEDGSNYTRPYSEDSSQPYRESNRKQYRVSIKKGISKKYYDAYPSGDEITMLQMKHEFDMQILDEFMYIVYEQEFDSAESLNKAITDYIHEQLSNNSNTIMSDLLHDWLPTGDMIHINTVIEHDYIISNGIIYKIVALIEDKIEQLKAFDTSNYGGNIHSSMSTTKEQHQEYADYLYSFKNQPINVYDIKTGKLLRREQYKPESKNYIVQKLDTYGMRHDINELEVGIN